MRGSVSCCTITWLLLEEMERVVLVVAVCHFHHHMVVA